MPDSAQVPKTYPPPQLALSVSSPAGEATPVAVEIKEVFNFGYAARDQDALRAHLSVTGAQGLDAPQTIPSLYGLTPDRATCSESISVVGRETYAEVEYAMVLPSSGRWLLTVASDHTDAVVEKSNVARGKAITPDVLSPGAWWLDDLMARFDDLTLTAEVINNERVVTQRDYLGSLLRPEQLIEIAERRLGRRLETGTIILSGTIGGEPPRGAHKWRISLEDSVSGRTLDHAYTVEIIDDELHEPSRA